MALPPFLEGDRVALRAYDADDVDFVLACRSSPELRGAAWPSLPISRAEIEEQARHSPSDRLLFVVEERASGRRVGLLSLYWLNWVARSADLGIEILDAADRGRGLGADTIATTLRYAFQELNLNRVGLGVLATNDGARRLYERLGFVAEGRHREAHFRDGRFVDDLRYSILRRDWDALRGPRK